MATDEDRSVPGDANVPAPVWSRNEPRIAGATHVGRVREVNQDAFGRFDDPDRSEILLVVADGLGGHLGGEVASRMAVDLLGKRVFEGTGDPPDRLRDGIARANRAILGAARHDRDLGGMGTTVVCLLLGEDGRSHVAHVGDSRLYRLRGGVIEPMTEDHSLVASLVREGVLTREDARDDPRANQILRALGVREEVEIEVAPLELLPGDVYILCSDGLHGMLDDEAIERLADRHTRPEHSVELLIDAANEAGGADNVTAIVAQVPQPMAMGSLRERATALFESTRSIFTRRDDRGSE